MRNNILIILVIFTIGFTGCTSKSSSIDSPIDTKNNISRNVDKNVDREVTIKENKWIDTWPRNFMPNLPEFQGVISSFVGEEDEGYVYISFQGVTYEVAIDYINQLRQSEFTFEAEEFLSDPQIDYKANDREGNYIEFRWRNHGFGGIIVEKKQDLDY